jgi:hypothetical protein
MRCSSVASSSARGGRPVHQRERLVDLHVAKIAIQDRDAGGGRVLEDRTERGVD